MLRNRGRQGNANKGEQWYHLTPVWIAIPQNQKKKCWQGCRGRGHLNILLVGMQIGTNSLMMHQNTKNKPTI